MLKLMTLKNLPHLNLVPEEPTSEQTLTHDLWGLSETQKLPFQACFSFNVHNISLLKETTTD